MPSLARTSRLVAATAAALVAGSLAATPAAAHQSDESSATVKRQQYMDGVSVPILSSPNIRLVDTFPDTAAISGVFAKGAPFFYVSSADSITVFDVSDPLHPKVRGVLPNLVFENEAMNYGETKVDGVVNRFVLVGADAVQYSPDDPTNVALFDEFLVVDVTNPDDPTIRSRVQTTTGTHTVSCIAETDCRYAYTSGGARKFSVVDLSDPDNPVEVDSDPATAGVQPFTSPAAGPNAAFRSGAGHKWNFDDAGYGIHTGSGGSAIFDVSDPTAPRLAATTDENGVQGPWNDFIHHNSARPNASAFDPAALPSLAKGNVLLVTEEDYENTDCATAGSFQSWQVTSLDGGAGTIHPLDRINPVDLGEGVSAPHMAFCSAHWFDVHQSGIVAQGYYEGGLRLIDARDPKDLKEYGYVASGLSEVWDAYWVPQRNKNGVATGSKTNIVYTVDAVRGLDVYTVDLPGSTSSTSLLGGLLSGAPRGVDPAGLILGTTFVGLMALVALRRRQVSGARV